VEKCDELVCIEPTCRAGAQEESTKPDLFRGQGKYTEKFSKKKDKYKINISVRCVGHNTPPL
jgi:hypothetical protein